MPFDNLTFGEALEFLKDGKEVRLPNWDRRDFLSLQEVDQTSKMGLPYIYKGYGALLVPWTPDQMELLCDQWEIGRSSRE